MCVNGNFSLFAQVWRVNGQEKILLLASDQSKLYSGDCFIFQYSYPGEDKEEYLIGTWFGKQSVEVKLSQAFELFVFLLSSFLYLFAFGFPPKSDFLYKR